MSQVLELKNQGAIRLRRAKALADQASWQVRDAERGVRVQVLRAFSAALLSQRRVRLAGETVALSRELLRVARELYEAGHVPRLDALRAEVEERLAVNEQTAAQRASTGLKRDLILLMGQPSDLPFEAVGSLAYGPLAIVERALAENALSVRPDVKAVEAGLQATEAEAALVQAEQTFPPPSICLPTTSSAAKRRRASTAPSLAWRCRCRCSIAAKATSRLPWRGGPGRRRASI